ncbi:Basic-leucine zipper domain [Sesbania bispinosa]|nr:Basic-leucine zipper domain [Sesbania bispinosa]
MDSFEEGPLGGPLGQLDWEAFFDKLPEFQVDDFLQEDESPVAVADGPSPNPILSEIENLLMADLPATPSSESDYDKLLAEILIEPRPDSEEGSVPSDKERVDPVTPEEAADEPMSKKIKRQMRNRDAAVRSRERKKMYVKNLEMKSGYYEGECKRLAHLLQCCYAENHALRLCLQSRGAFGAPVTMQESAVLLLVVCGVDWMFISTLGVLMDFVELEIPAAGFPAVVHGHHVPTQSTPDTVANRSTSKRKHGTERPKKGGSKRARK